MVSNYKYHISLKIKGGLANGGLKEVVENKQATVGPNPEKLAKIIKSS